MTSSEHLTLAFTRDRLPREEAEQAGLTAYKYFSAHREPSLNPLTLLSHAIRDYKHLTLNDAQRNRLTTNGFLRHGEKTPLKQRLLLPGIVAVSLVVPEIEDGQIVGEHLAEPFKEAAYLKRWYEAKKRRESDPGTRLSWLR